MRNMNDKTVMRRSASVHFYFVQWCVVLTDNKRSVMKIKMIVCPTLAAALNVDAMTGDVGSVQKESTENEAREANGEKDND